MTKETYNAEKWRAMYEEKKLLIAARIIEKAKEITRAGHGSVKFVKEGE